MNHVGQEAVSTSHRAAGKLEGGLLCDWGKNSILGQREIDACHPALLSSMPILLTFPDQKMHRGMKLWDLVYLIDLRSVFLSREKTFLPSLHSADTSRPVS